MRKIKKEQFVLIDYDNLGPRLKKIGIYQLSYEIIDWLSRYFKNPNEQLFIIKLYGGWYEGHSLTRRAQKLTIEINDNVPSQMTLGNKNGALYKASVKVELAYSLISKPNKILYATLRNEKRVKRLECKTPQQESCFEADCPFSIVKELTKDNSCTNNNCSRLTDSFLYREEQKMVDSMLVADLINLSCIRKEPTCIVSSDDDMWPGIITSVSTGIDIYHIHTQNKKDQHSYAPAKSRNYKSHSLAFR